MGLSQRTETRRQKRPIVGFVLRAVFHAPRIVNDGRRRNSLLGAVLRDDDFPFQQVKDVLTVVVDVGVEGAPGAEREQLYQYVVLDDEFRGFDRSSLGREVRQFVQRHTGASVSTELKLRSNGSTGNQRFGRAFVESRISAPLETIDVTYLFLYQSCYNVMYLPLVSGYVSFTGGETVSPPYEPNGRAPDERTDPTRRVMKSQELINIHRLLFEVRRYLEREGAVSADAFAAYDAQPIRPTHFHRGKGAHMGAIELLLEGLDARQQVLSPA